MKISAWVLACALAFVSSCVEADDVGPMTAGDLQKICTAASTENQSACGFYILGISQGISLGMSIADGKTKGERPCIPDSTSGSVLELTVKMKLGQDLMAYPGDKKLDASSAIGAILVSSFPCQKAR